MKKTHSVLLKCLWRTGFYKFQPLKCDNLDVNFEIYTEITDKIPNPLNYNKNTEEMKFVLSRMAFIGAIEFSAYLLSELQGSRRFIVQL